MQGNDELLEIIKHYGLEAQLKKFNEEVYELLESIIQKDNILHITEEYADVVLVLSQIGLYLNIDPNEVDKIVDYKVKRTKEKIKKEIEKNNNESA